MKKAAIATSALLAVTLFSTLAPAAHAADITKGTTGDVNFVANPATGAGELKLISAPSVDFGDQEISGSTKTYEQTSFGAKPEDANIQVDDNRGSNVGWNLTVANTQFATATGTALDGAKLTLSSGTIKNSNGTGSVANPAATMLLDGSAKAVPAVDAAKDKGMGLNTLPVTKATLEVPGATSKLNEKYTSTITWTLKDAAL